MDDVITDIGRTGGGAAVDTGGRITLGHRVVDLALEGAKAAEAAVDDTWRLHGAVAANTMTAGALLRVQCLPITDARCQRVGCRDGHWSDTQNLEVAEYEWIGAEQPHVQLVKVVAYFHSWDIQRVAVLYLHGERVERWRGAKDICRE